MSLLKKMFYGTFCLLGAFLCGINIAMLMPNDNYHATWWKAAVSLGFCLMFGIMLIDEIRIRKE